MAHTTHAPQDNRPDPARLHDDSSRRTRTAVSQANVPKGVSLPDDLLAKLRAAVAAEGERAVMVRLRLSRNAFNRALGGLSVYAGTHALVRAGLGGNP